MLGGISMWQLLIVLAIIIMIFGTKKLRNAGGDLGAAMRNFKKQVKDSEDEAKADAAQLKQQGEAEDAGFSGAKQPETGKTV